MYWDRFDICEAFNLLAHDWGLYDVKARLDAMSFRCAPAAEFYEGLTDNGRAIYDHHNNLLTMSDSPIRSTYI